MKIDSLSVFFPAYNEEGNIKNTIEKAINVLNKLSLKNYEIIVINDGSKDKTGQIVEDLIKKNDHIRLITHNINQGYGEAIKDGLYNSKFDWIVYNDSDGQFDFSEVTRFLAKADQADIIVGYRINRKDPWIRKFNAWGWTLLANTLLRVGVKDVDCAFKLINKKVIDSIPHLESRRGGMVNPELLAKAKRAGFRIVEIGVHHYPRTTGVQTGANLKVIFKSFSDLFKLWWKIK